jgi:Mrp family chromosome partitioning ATPase
LLVSLTGVPVLAVIPPLAVRANRWSMLAGSVRLRRRQAGNPFGDVESQTAPFIAAFRRLGDALFDGAGPQQRRTLLMTSATQGEGRTTTALNLALTSAASGLRVLLVDADIKRGTLSRTLNAAGNAGLFDLIEGRATLSSVLLSDTETGLSFLPLGNSTKPESRNLIAQDVALKLSDPAQGFGLVIVDAGAVLPDDYTRPLADLADDVVFVVRAGGPIRAEITASFEALRLNARKVRGAVLTGAAADAG